MRRLRTAVVGCGAVSEIYHLPAVARVPAAELVAVADTDLDRARAAAARFGATVAVADYRELPDDVEAAIVATSNASHAEIACALLARGTHVLCEKPMATTAADAERMIAAAGRGKARLMAAHCRRFNPNVAALRALVQRGVLGDVRTISAALGGKYGAWPQRTDFRRQRSLAGGGVLVDIGTHLIDLALWLGAESAVVESYVAADALGWGIECDADVTLRFAGGERALLSCSYTHAVNRTLRVEGSEGWAETSVDGSETVMLFSHRAMICRRAGAQALRLTEADPYERQLAHFIKAILEDAPFIVRGEEVVAGLRVIEDCYRRLENAA